MATIDAPPAEKIAPESNLMKEKAAQFAPSLLQPLVSMPPTDPIPSPQPKVASVKDNVAPHNYDHMFIMEKLDKFLENPFNSEMASLLIPLEVIEQASTLVNELRDASIKVNALTTQMLDLDAHMKTMTSKFVINELEVSYKELNRTITMLCRRRLHFHFDLDQMV